MRASSDRLRQVSEYRHQAEEAERAAHSTTDELERDACRKIAAGRWELARRRSCAKDEMHGPGALAHSSRSYFHAGFGDALRCAALFTVRKGPGGKVGTLGVSMTKRPQSELVR